MAWDYAPTDQCCVMIETRSAMDMDETAGGDICETTGPFSEHILDPWTPCTGIMDARRECRVFQELTYWNEYFWHIGLELREDEKGTGKLVLIAIQGPCRDDFETGPVRQGFEMLERLLLVHRCIVAVTVSSITNQACHNSFFDALRANGTVQRLTLPESRLYGSPAFSASIARALSVMEQLRELVCSEEDFCDFASTQKFAEFLFRTKCLRKLDIRLTNIKDTRGCTLYEGLQGNRSLTSLTMRNLYLQKSDNAHYAALSDLLRGHETLQSLTLDSLRCHYMDTLQLVADSIASNGTLRDLTLSGWLVDANIVAGVGQMIAQNVTLMSFALVRCSFESTCSNGEGFHVDGVINAEGISPLITALERNTSLKEVAFDLCCLTPDACQKFVAALEARESLRKITLEPERYEHVAEICQQLRDASSAQSLTTRGSRKTSALSAFMDNGRPQTQRFAFDCSSFWQEKERPLVGLFFSPSLGTVTTLRMKIGRYAFKNRISGLLSDYLVRTRTLKELSLTLTTCPPDPIGTRSVAYASSELSFVEALAVNNSLRRVLISGMSLQHSECVLLAQVLRHSRRIYDFSYRYRDYPSTGRDLVEAMAPSFSEENWTLLAFRLDRLYWRMPISWFVVCDTVRRNCALATLAACFVSGRVDARGAEALEKIFRLHGIEICKSNPGLVVKLRELLPCLPDDGAAHKLIEDTVRALDSVHGFMRAVGVVRSRVECYPHPEGLRQLADINHYAWTCVRRYLRYTDVLLPVPASH